MDVVICAWAEVEEWVSLRDFAHAVSIGASQSAPPPALADCPKYSQGHLLQVALSSPRPPLAHKSQLRVHFSAQIPCLVC